MVLKEVLKSLTTGSESGILCARVRACEVCMFADMCVEVYIYLSISRSIYLEGMCLGVCVFSFTRAIATSELMCC